jgi:ATP-dependent 26S proteasome regulatory subunit
MKNSNKLPENHGELVNLYLNRLKENKDLESKLKTLRVESSNMSKQVDKLEENLKAIQNTGQLIGEILKKIDSEKCKKILLIILSYCKTSQRSEICCNL